jgi:lysophospholipase L1-like esterase
MRLEHAGAFAVFVAAAAVGAVGVYLTFGLVASALHPRVMNSPPEQRRTALTQSAPSEPLSEARGNPDQPVVATAEPPAKAEPKSEPKAEPAPEPKPALTKLEEAAPDLPAVAPIEIEVADPKLFSVGGAAASMVKRGLSILQIGDSHTSADFLSGELRRRLQARYGRGGSGYMTAGHPHIGVRSSTMKITASAGWTYKSLQKPDARPGEFWLSGYDAIATMPGETMTFASEEPHPFDVIEIEAIGQPGGGAIDIKFDDNLASHYDLSAARIEPVVIRLLPEHGPTGKVREVSITTTSAGTVALASVSIYNNRSGVTYNSVGYVGAQASLLNKMNEKLFADDLKRINPQIVVLSFGTNEASNEHLDPAQYAKTYERVVRKIKAALPGVAIVVVSPPDFNELPSSCPKDKAAEATCRRSTHEPAVAANLPPSQAGEGWEGGGPTLASSPLPNPPPQAGESKGGGGECVWRTPGRLAQVREVQREIARRDGLAYWNWASIMPAECGAHQWFTASPPLMARDHVHFSTEGYRRSAGELLKVLIPMIEKVRVGANAVSNN